MKASNINRLCFLGCSYHGSICSTDVGFTQRYKPKITEIRLVAMINFIDSNLYVDYGWLFNDDRKVDVYGIAKLLDRKHKARKND